MLKAIKNEKGSGLIMVLIVMMIMGVLGTAALTAMGAEARQSSIHDNKTQAYYLARSGAEIAHEMIKKQDYNFTGDLNYTGDLHNIESGTDNSKPININIAKGPQNITIKSTGKHNGTTETATIEIQHTSDIQLTEFTHAVFSLGKIELGGNSSITGQVATNVSGGQVSLGKINGYLYLLDPSSASSNVISNVTEGIKPLSHPITFPMPQFPMFPDLPTLTQPGNLDLTLDGDYRIVGTDGKTADLNLSGNNSNNPRKIKIGNQDRSLVVNSLDLKNTTIEGTGVLTIYVEESLNFDGTINTGKADQLIIYLKGTGNASTNKLIATGSQTHIHASVHAEDANIEITSNSSFHGHIITGGKKVDFGGSGAATIQAIYAPFAFVDLRGGGNIRGVVICESLKMQGNTTLKYEDLSGDSTLEGLIETKTFRSIWR